MKTLSIFRFTTLGLMVLVAALQSRAASCFHNLKEYKAQSANLPPSLNKMPMLGSVDTVIAGKPAIATLKIRMVGGHFKSEARQLDKKEVKEQSEYIDQICYDQGVIEVNLENGEKYKAELTEDGFKYQKNFFVWIHFVSDEKEFDRVNHKIDNAKILPLTSPSQQNSGVQ